jgi:hypothetical protein
MRLLLTILLTLLTLTGYSQNLAHKNRICKAIYKQESNCGKDTINELDRESQGYFQIRKELVDDVNRILGTKRFEYKDRFDYKESVLMFFYYTDYYVPSWDYEQVAKNWGCGPRAKERNKCQTYWERTKKILGI